MIVSLLKEILKWSLAVANKGKSSWCFYVKKLLIIHIDLGHLNPENVTCLSANEFQIITIVKLTDKANRKWQVWTWNPNAYSSDSRGRLHNDRVIKQTSSPESYLCRHKYHLQKTPVDHGCPLRGFPPTARWWWDTEHQRPHTNLQTCKLCWLNSVETEVHFVMEFPAQQDLRSCFFDCISYLDNSFTPLPQIEKFKYILGAK